MSMIELINISKQYTSKHKKFTALQDINITVNNSTLLALTGPSGSGKSTVLQIIGLIEEPSLGHVIIDGKDLIGMSNSALTTFRRQKIGIIFQQFYLEPTLTLRQNIELPAMFFNLPIEARDERTSELATFMGLSNHLNHLSSELSGGQIQRAAIARAIYHRPTILIADEPTSNLDLGNVTNIIEMFRRIRQTYGTTIIIATHDEHIIQSADQVIKLDNGRIVL